MRINHFVRFHTEGRNTEHEHHTVTCVCGWSYDDRSPDLLHQAADNHLSVFVPELAR